MQEMAISSVYVCVYLHYRYLHNLSVGKRGDLVKMKGISTNAQDIMYVCMYITPALH